LFFSLFEQPETRTKTNKTKTAIQLLLILFFMNSLPKIFGIFYPFCDLYVKDSHTSRKLSRWGMLKNAHLLRYAANRTAQRISMYASQFGFLRALPLWHF
jgi:hypothetical protein